jgi:hypothetical protein
MTMHDRACIHCPPLAGCRHLTRGVSAAEIAHWAVHRRDAHRLMRLYPSLDVDDIRCALERYAQCPGPDVRRLVIRPVAALPEVAGGPDSRPSLRDGPALRPGPRRRQESSMTGLVCFAHGKESGPWGRKITHLAEVAQRRGWRVESPDYRFTRDPDERVAHLESLGFAGNGQHAPLVLAGSSMGGYVSAVVSNRWRPAGLFLMAPALYMPGYEADVAPRAGRVAVVHGWRDDVIPVDKTLEFARRYRADCHLIDSGHTLNDHLPLLGVLFERFLITVEG